MANFSADALSFVVPAGADTGPITIDVGAQKAASQNQLQIVALSSFSLTAAPAEAEVIAGHSGAFALTLDSPDGFSLLASLTVNGLPATLTPNLRPASITAGQTAVLIVDVAPGEPQGPVTFTVAASAEVDGIPQSDSVTLVVPSENSVATLRSPM